MKHQLPKPSEFHLNTRLIDLYKFINSSREQEALTQRETADVAANSRLMKMKSLLCPK